ncbi:MAG: DUF2344 domain-containing protein [Clostridia bacterium]|nr:DUF2344 domain-containing protein [Clostridia bacterium]
MKEYVPFTDVRAVFEKTGAAKYFSHLDLTRTVSRALRRSRLDIWMTEGFSPRPHLVFTPPLSLGYESVCEIMDFRLNLGAELDKDAFISSFPPALSIKDVYFPERKLKEIEYAGYTLTLRADKPAEQISALFSAPVMLLKKTKRSEQIVDITKFIKSLDLSENNGIIKMSAVLSCSGSESLSPAYLISALAENGITAENISVCRTAFYDGTMNIFR